MSKGSTALVADPKQAYGQLQEYLIAKRGALTNVAPKYMDSERMIRLALGASSRQPRLLQCSPKSWLMALMDCAYYGIEPNPALGHAYLVPYQNRKLAGQPYEVTFQIGYKGLVLLACESGGFDDVEARIVYRGELNGRFIEQPEDPARPFMHRPVYDPEERGDVAGAYAIGWRGVDKRPRFQYLTIEEIEGYRGRSRAAKDGPWVTDYEAMAKKTAIKRMLQYAAIRTGSKLGAVLEQEGAIDRGDEIVRAQDWQVGDPPARGSSRSTELASKLAQKAEEPSRDDIEQGDLDLD